MKSSFVDKNLWEAVFTTRPPEVPLDVMSRLIQMCKENPDIEQEIVQVFEEILHDKDEEWDGEFYWIMVILAKAGSRKSIPLFLRCLSQFPDHDFVLEVVDQCLVWLGEPAVREAMVWLKEKRTFVEKLYVAGVFESVPDYGDADLIDEVKSFLKDQITVEENSEAEEDCLSQYLTALACFPGEDVLPFVRSVVGRYEYHVELDAAFQMAEGRFPLERENEYARDWKEFCELYAWRLDPDGQIKAQERQKHMKRLLQGVRTAWQAKDCVRIIELGQALKKEDSRGQEFSMFLCAAYASLQMNEEFEAEAAEAMKKMQKTWKECPSVLDYKNDIESFAILRGASRLASEEERYFLVSRFGEYMRGFLQDLGYVRYDTAISRIKDMVNAPEVADRRDLRQYFFEHQNETFLLKDDYIALKSVEDLDLLVSEFQKRTLTPVYPDSLTKIKLMQEGRRHELYTTEERALDQEIRILTLGCWNLELFRSGMRNDIAGFTGRDRLIEKMQVYFENFSRLVGCVFEAWNICPRWELGGRAPKDIEISGKTPAGSPVKKRHKTGRNDPCPCGSGKKYKKCCGV